LQGVSRSDHMDTTVRKATELGVTTILPLSCERSVPIKREQTGKKLERWRQIAVSACEQSGRNTLPVIPAVTGFSAAIGQHDAAVKLVLDPAAEAGIRNLKIQERPTSVLCGPEGGLSEREIAAAVDAGYSRIRLGPRVLRTETAGPAMITALQTLWGDMG